MVPSGAPPPIGGAQQSLLRSTSSLLGGAAAQPSPRNQYGALGGIPTLLNHSFAGNGGPGAAEPDPLSFPSSSGLSQGQHFPVKMEQPGGGGEPNGLSLQQQYGFRGGGVKIEQPQSMVGLGPVKMESQGADQSQSVFMQQQRHQQHMLQLRQNSQAAATTQLNLLQQQQILHMQQQQQQMMKNLPQQRNQLPPPSQQQQQQMNQMNQSGLAGRAQAKPNPYEPGTCARRLTQYMNHQQHRPEDNNIEFWRNFVGMYFAPNARKRWCVSLYGSGRQTTGVFPQDVWHCEICNRKPGRGFETTVEVLPRLCQIKYASGTLEELLYVDMPREYQNASGQIILDYAKAIQESVFDQLRVVRDGQLRIVFNPDLKISSWEFCARRHEELIPRRLLIPQVSQLGAVVQKHQAAGQNSSSSLSTQDLQNTCNSFVTTARQLAKALEVPLVNDLGYTKRYVRCLQISEVVNSMKDLIDYSRETGTGPIDSLINFPRRSSASSGVRTQQPQQQDGQQLMSPNANQNDHNVVHAAMQLPAASNGIGSVNNPTVSSITTSTTTAVGLHQNSMSSRQDNQMSAVNSPYGVGNSAQIPSASSSSSIPTQHPNPSSPFSSPTMSASNNNPASNFHSGNQLTSTDTQANISPLQQTTQSQEVDTNDSVHQFLQNIMASQMNGASSLGNEMKGINGVAPVLNGANCLVGNGMGANSTNSSIGGIGFSSMGALGQPATLNGMRGAIQNNAMAMSGRAAMNPMSQDPSAMSHQQQHNMGNRLLGGFGASNSYNNLQFDWKPSP